MDKEITIILLEDNPGDAILMRRMLSNINGNFLVTHVTRLSDALELLDREATDVLLLDLELPDSSGLETLASIRAKSPSVPIIVITGLSEREIAVKSLGLGARDFIAKERVDRLLLEKAIRRAVGPVLEDNSPATS